MDIDQAFELILEHYNGQFKNEGSKPYKLNDRFKRSYRASKDRVSSISIMAPDLGIQKEGVKKIEQIEQDIVKNNKALSELFKERKEIIESTILNKTE